MKKFSTIFEGKSSIDVQDDAVNYLSSSEISAYLKKVGNRLSEETKYICQWLIDNNSSYVKKFGGENAIASFYSAGIPSDESLRELYKNIGVLSKKGCLLEIPTLQTKEQFDGICKGTVALDEVVMDLTTEKGRNAVAKRYEPLCIKIARSWMGKSTVGYDDLISAAHEGLVYAMETYGKKSKKRQKREEDGLEDELDMETYKKTSFTQYAAFLIRNRILGDVEDSHLVRVPKSAQKRERDEQGHNTKSDTVSGDTPVGGNDNEGAKTMFDFIDAEEDSDKDIDREELDKYREKLWKECEKHFGEKIMDLFYSFAGIRGYEQVKGKDLAKKYNMSPANVSTYIGKVQKFMQTDPTCKHLGTAIIELMHECEMSSDANVSGEPYRLKNDMSNDSED